MTERASSARVIRALTADRHIRFAAMEASALWDGLRRGHPHLPPAACGVLVELMTAAVLLQARTFFSERLQVLLKGAGRAKAVLADVWPGGDVRGVLDQADHQDGAYVAPPGIFQVMRSNPAGQPYIGQLALVEGPVSKQLEAYLQQSEQIQACCDLWCDPSTGEAGGVLVEPMPACPPERLAQLLQGMDGLEVVPLWERDPAFLARWLNGGDGAEILASSDMRYFCRCTRENLLQTLGGFPSERLDELFQGKGPVEVRCDYCGKAYEVTREELTGGKGEHDA